MTRAPQPLLCGLLLAAGGSKRFGEPKQLQEWQGQSLVKRAADLLLEVCGAGVTVVTGCHHRRVSDELLGRELNIVVNPDWDTGMAGSLSCGIEACQSGGSTAALILLCDQPLVSVDDLFNLVTAWSVDTTRPAAAGYSGIVGVPAIIPLATLNEFRQVQPDAGASALLRDQQDVRVIDMPHAAVDIDTPEDLQKLTKQ
jgi:molybdenum cofactor cytidylyltransferase